MTVKLRTKPISDNRKSLYLDFYPPIPHPQTGKQTRREFLGLYLFDKAKTPIDKLQNKETLALAENIRAKRQIEIQNGEYGLNKISKIEGLNNGVYIVKLIIDGIQNTTTRIIVNQ